MPTLSRPKLTTACILAMLGGLAGCEKYDSKQVNAFLCQERTPVSGLEYRVLPPDLLGVSSRNVPEINEAKDYVRPDGKINLPLVGELDAAGKTPHEIEMEINRAASRYYAEVDSTVQILSYNSQKYFVFGQVSNAGPRPWTGHDMLLDALAVAQPTNLAWPERIIVVRGTVPQEGGQSLPQTKKYADWGVHPDSNENPPHKLLINLMGMVQSGDLSNNIMLMPNDIIYVQPNPLAAVGLALQNILFPIRPAADTVTVPGSAMNMKSSGN